MLLNSASAVMIGDRPASAVYLGIHKVWGSAPAWTPAALFAGGEQGVWLDESDLSSMFQDLNGTVPAAVDSPVGKRLDKSGNGNHWTATNSSARPVLRLTAGKYSLQWDGVDDAGATAAINFTATNTVTIVSGSNALASSTRIFMELSASASSNNGSFYLTANESAAGVGTARVRGTTATGGGYVVPFDQPRLAVTAFTLKATTNPTTIARVNGADVSVTDYGSTTPANLGTYPLYIGARGGKSLFFTGHTYQEIVRGAASTLAEIEAAETYVNAKTGAY